MINDNTFRTSGGDQLSPAEVIKRYRTQMLIHSYLYYWLDDPIWSDDKWQQVADDLAELQILYPEPIGYYDDSFSDWTGATGSHLPKDGEIPSKALAIFRLCRGEQHGMAQTI